MLGFNDNSLSKLETFLLGLVFLCVLPSLALTFTLILDAFSPGLCVQRVYSLPLFNSLYPLPDRALNTLSPMVRKKNALHCSCVTHLRCFGDYLFQLDKELYLNYCRCTNELKLIVKE